MPDGSPVERRGNAGLVNLANVVTFVRLCAVPLAFWLVLVHRIDEAFLLFVAAGLSDALDGWLARRYGGNAVGALIDPVADKALLVTMYITLAAIGVLPAWLAILVVFRDLLIVGGIVGVFQVVRFGYLIVVEVFRVVRLDPVPDSQLHPGGHHAGCDLEVDGVVGDGDDGRFQARRGVHQVARLQ